VSYEFKPGRSISSEVTRLVDKQLALAVAELRSLGNPRSDAAIHEARRHVKKVRAALKLVQPALGDAYYPANTRMRLVSRMLAPIADGEAVVDTIARLKKRYGSQLPPRTVASMRAALVERSIRIDRKAELDRVLPRAGSILSRQRRRTGTLRLNAHGFRAVAAGLEASSRRARRAMRRAGVQPTAESYHVWRQRVKDLWLQVRLVDERCGHRLDSDQRQLEILDGYLGEHHNVMLLEQVLTREAIVSREQTARCLRVLRQYQAELRDRAHALGIRILEEKPRQFVRRVRRLWHAVERRARTTARMR
jgi:CHAD domain-containing protein